MKKFFKILTALTLALTVVVSATACGKIKNMSDIYDFEKPLSSTAVLSTATKLTVGDYTDCEAVVGRYVVLSRTVTTVSGEEQTTTYDYALYDWKNKAFSDSVDGLEVKSSPYVLLSVFSGLGVVAKTPTEDGGDYTVFYNGENSFVSESIEVTKNANGINVCRIGDYVIYLDGEELKAVENKKIKVEDVCALENGYFYREDTAGKMLLIYDSALNLYGKVNKPTYASDVSKLEKWFFPLSNGNVLVQYLYVADQYGDEYDVILEDGNKYFVKQQIFSAVDNTVEDVKLGYVVTDCSPASVIERQARYQIKDRIHNICDGYLIEERRVSFAEAEKVIFSMSNDGEISVFEKSFKTQSYTLEIALGEDSFVSFNVANDIVLIDKKGNVKLTFENQVDCSSGTIIDGNKYYSLEGNLILDNSDGKYLISQRLSGGIIFSKAVTADTFNNVEYYLMSNGAFRQIAVEYDANDTAREISSKVVLGANSVSEGIYAIESVSKKDGKAFKTVTFYNANGEKLYEYLPSNDEKGNVFKDYKIKYYGSYGVVMEVGLDKWDAESEQFVATSEIIVFESAKR